MNFQYSKAKLDSQYRTKQKELLRGCTEVEIRIEPKCNGKNGTLRSDNMKGYHGKDESPD